MTRQLRMGQLVPKDVNIANQDYSVKNVKQERGKLCKIRKIVYVLLYVMKMQE